MPAPRRGFTLFEMILVLAIIVLLAALTVPAFQGMFADFNLNASSDAVRANWETARSHSMNEGRPYRFAVVYGKGNFRIAPDSPEFWGDGGSAGEGSPGTLSLDRRATLPRGVRFIQGDMESGLASDSEGESSLPADGVDMAMWTTVATFLPDGTTHQDVILYLGCQGTTQRIELRLRSLTGTVSMRSFDEGDALP